MRRLLSLFCWIVCCLPGIAVAGSTEEQLRAAYVAGFGSYVEWPAHVFSSAQAPFVIGVMGDEDMRLSLERAFANRRVQGRQVEVRSVDNPQQAAQVQVLYVHEGLRAPLQQLSGLPVLTVGSGSNFIDGGGIIRLVVLDQRLRFELNARGAERAGLKVSAKLQQLAVNAHEEAR